mgnify:CR=1 FL=1
MFYDLAFSFWSQVSTEQAKLPGGTAFAHTDVPYYLSNAAWYPKIGELASVTEWYAARNLPPSLIVPSLRDDAVEQTLQDGPFMLEKSFHFRAAEANFDTAHIVEQVSWSQSRYAAELLANAYEQPDLSFAIAKSLTTALQAEPKIQLFLAYGDKPVGTMVTFESEDVLSAMLLVGSDGSLETRLVQEAESRGLNPLILELLPDHTTLKSVRGLERWSIY